MWSTYLVVVGCTTVAYFSLSTTAQSILYDVVGISAAGAMLAGIRRHRPSHRSAYLLLTFGVLDLALGDLVFGTSQSVPSPADMLYISAYPLLALGIFDLIPRRNGPASRRSDPLVAVAIAMAVALISWAFLILPTPTPTPQRTSLSTRIVAMGYPLMDLVLIGLLLRALSHGRFRTASAGCLGAAISLLLVADGVYAWSEFGTTYALGGAIDAAWLLAYGCFGAALLHPSLNDDLVLPPLQPWQAPVHIAPGSLAVRLNLEPARFSQPANSAFHIRLIAIWAGRSLLGLAAVTLVLSAVWLTPNLVQVAGSYALTGMAMMAAGHVHS
jgi:hypothetical protein